MIHYIIVKFKKDIDKKKISNEIKKYFNENKDENTLSFEIFDNVIERDNRYDLMIKLNIKDLDIYDNSKMHKLYKETFSQYIEKKVIFDYD